MFYSLILGVGWIVRQMIKSSSPTLTVFQDDDKFELILSSMMKTRETKFTVGVDFEEVQHSGEAMKVKD